MLYVCFVHKITVLMSQYIMANTIIIVNNYISSSELATKLYYCKLPYSGFIAVGTVLVCRVSLLRTHKVDVCWGSVLLQCVYNTTSLVNIHYHVSLLLR